MYKVHFILIIKVDWPACGALFVAMWFCGMWLNWNFQWGTWESSNRKAFHERGIKT